MAYVKLIDLVRRFDSGAIELPLMQRDYVWPAAKVVNLLDSLYRGWPIGVFYIWQTPTGQETRNKGTGDRVGRQIEEQFLGYLLDGQQRLTSLSRALDPPPVIVPVPMLAPKPGFAPAEPAVA